MKFPITAAELNARDQIVMSQPAKNNAYYKQALWSCDEMHHQERGRILKEWKESKTWEYEYDCWDDACKDVAEMTRRHADRLIAQYSQSQVVLDKNVQNVSTLEKVKKAYPEEKPTPKASFSAENTDEVEKPQVRAAIATSKPSENGKPKSQLAIWTHVHDSYGALLRDVDRLHNLAPKESLHNEVLTLTKRAMECIRKWQSEV